MRNVTNLMIVTNSKYLEPAYVMLTSLFLHHIEDEIDIYLPYEDLTEQELRELVQYIEAIPGKRIYPLYIGKEFKERVTSNSGINIETYYRILGVDLLPKEVERILYLDVDMVVKGSLWGLYNTQIEGHPFVVCEDIFGIINGFHEENIQRLAIPEEYTYFNAGVMLFNVAYLRENNCVEEMLESIYRNYQRYIYNDQDVMNELYHKKVVFAGWDEYNCPPAWYYLSKKALEQGKLEFARYSLLQEQASNPVFAEEYQNVSKQIYDNAKIIHYLGDTKPWSKTRKAAVLFELFDQAYDVYYKQYMELWAEIFGN